MKNWELKEKRKSGEKKGRNKGRGVWHPRNPHSSSTRKADDTVKSHKWSIFSIIGVLFIHTHCIPIIASSVAPPSEWSAKGTSAATQLWRWCGSCCYLSPRVVYIPIKPANTAKQDQARSSKCVCMCVCRFSRSLALRSAIWRYEPAPAAAPQKLLDE